MYWLWQLINSFVMTLESNTENSYDIFKKERKILQIYMAACVALCKSEQRENELQTPFL